MIFPHMPSARTAAVRECPLGPDENRVGAAESLRLRMYDDSEDPQDRPVFTGTVVDAS